MRNRTYQFLLASALTLGIAFACQAAVYQESGGQVVVEAVHFDYRNFEFTDAAIPHHFHIVPDEDNVTSAEHPWGDAGVNVIANSRTGRYVQIVPDIGQNKGNCPTCPNENVGFPPYVEYKVNITTLGQYQLYLRQVGFDGGSDSFFGQILEFAPPGPGPNFYRYAPNPDSGDFAALRNIPSDVNTENQGWSGYAAPAPRVDGGDNMTEVPAVYNITTPGLYTIRLSQREDGAAVDAIILQLASLTAPTNSPAPIESAISTVNPPYGRAVDPTPGQQQVPPDNNIGCQLVNGPTKNVATNTIRLIVDGATVSPSITQTSSVTYVSYSPSPLLTSGKAINWSVIFSDNGTPATSYTNTFPFSVLPYSPIPTNFLVAPGLVDTTKPGFLLHPYQTDATSNPNAAQPNTLAWTEDQLRGLHGPNVADLSGADANGFYAETNVVNYDLAATPSIAGTIAADNFDGDLPFPGIPGPTAPDTGNSTEEILTWLDLKAGVYRMVVNSDDGFKVSVASDPRDTAGLVVGSFDGGRGFADSLFIFVVPQDGFYPFRLLWENGNGDFTVAGNAGSLEWFTQNVFGRKALVNSNTNGTLATKAYRSGPSYPYVSRFLNSLFGFTIDYKDNGGIVLNKDTFQVTLDGSPITTSIGKTNGVTTINYAPVSVLASNSTHTIGLAFNDSGAPAKTYTRSIDFTVQPYVTLPPSYAAGTPDTTKPGFTLHVWRIDAQDATGAEIIVDPNDTVAHAELELAGMVTNTATGRPYTNSAIANPADGSFTYLEPAVINYSRDLTTPPAGALGFGDFQPDVQMPGIMGTTDLETANAAMEILTYVTLPAGLVRMGVNSDDGFRLSPATSVSDSRNALTLGIFDAGRGATDSIFDFYVAQAGTYPMRLVWDNGGGDCNVEWFSVLADGTKVLINDSTNTAFKAYRAAATAQLPPQITSATISTGTITIQWSNGGTLESTTSLSTTPINWTPTGNSSGTFSEAATGTKFYRVKK